VLNLVEPPVQVAGMVVIDEYDGGHGLAFFFLPLLINKCLADEFAYCLRAVGRPLALCECIEFIKKAGLH